MAMDLFTPCILDGVTLKNRIVMAPMTRCRALEGNVPNPLAIQYYSQRASAGLIITEGSQVSPQGIGYIRTPGIHNPDQMRCWKRIVKEVHRQGGVMFIQLWHTGRVSHPDFHGGNLPVGPSALPVDGEVHTPLGKKPILIPRALELSEIPDIIEQFRNAAVCAKKAGFDGVEIHGANGYLLDQFLRDSANKRTDAYGGSLNSRMRLPLEVAGAVSEIWGPERVGYRISPHYTRYSMSDSRPEETFTQFASELSKIGIGYLHLVESRGGRLGFVPSESRIAPLVRKVFTNYLMVNGGYDAASGNDAIATNAADLVSFGEYFLANPDLPERFRRNAPLNRSDMATYYEGEERGYTDYPALEAGPV